MAASAIANVALYLPDGSEPDDFDQTTAADFGGRYACPLCADNRDACELAERELERATALLGRATAILRLIARTEARPAKPEGGETPNELALVGYAQTFAAIKARIELYLQSAQSAR